LTSGQTRATLMGMSELQDMIADAREELARASRPLTPEEQDEERHKVETDKLQGFLLRRLLVAVPVALGMEVAWISGGPAAILKYEDQTFHLRKAGDDDCVLFLIEGQGETEIARIKAEDPLFASRLLVAIGGGQGD